MKMDAVGLIRIQADQSIVKGKTCTLIVVFCKIICMSIKVLGQFVNNILVYVCIDDNRNSPARNSCVVISAFISAGRNRDSRYERISTVMKFLDAFFAPVKYMDTAIDLCLNLLYGSVRNRAAEDTNFDSVINESINHFTLTNLLCFHIVEGKSKNTKHVIHLLLQRRTGFTCANVKTFCDDGIFFLFGMNGPFSLLVAVSLLSGIEAAFGTTLVNAAIGERFDSPEERAKWISIAMACLAIGSMLSNVVGGMIGALEGGSKWPRVYLLGLLYIPAIVLLKCVLSGDHQSDFNRSARKYKIADFSGISPLMIIICFFTWFSILVFRLTTQIIHFT